MLLLQPMLYTEHMVKIGVFDSGIGGQAVADKLALLFPAAQIISINDSANVPYGARRRIDILRLTNEAIQPLIRAKCDVIVIACNTATTNAIHDLRTMYPHIHFVGIEPMIKPAARMTKTGVIGVLATNGTLRSDRYAQLKHQWALRHTIIEPDCSNWASLIERGDIDQIDIYSVISNLLRWQTDVIVLGCTHYHHIKDRIQAIAGPTVHVIEPTDAIGSRIDTLFSTGSVLPE